MDRCFQSFFWCAAAVSNADDSRQTHYTAAAVRVVDDRHTINFSAQGL